MATNGTLPVWFDYVESVVSYLCMASVLITLPVYILVVFIMIALRKDVYNGMFYRLFMVGAVVDIISLVNAYVGAIFPAKGWFIDFYMAHGTLTGQIYLVIAWTARFIQGCTVTLLALNRATAICSPVKHRKIWKSKWISLAFVFQIGIGVLVGFPLLTQQYYWKQQAGGYYIQFSDLKFRITYFLMAYSVDTLFVLTIIVTNVVMLVTFRRKYISRHSAQVGQMGSRTMTEKQKQENNLTIVSCSTCLVEVTYYLYLLYAFGINTTINTRIFYLVYNFFNDIYGGVSCWLILFCSASLQEHVKNVLSGRYVLGKRKPSNKQFSSITTVHIREMKTTQLQIRPMT